MSRLPIARRALADKRTNLIWWGVGLGGYALMIMAVWPTIEGNDEFTELLDSYPESIQAMMGGTEAFAAFTTPEGFLNIYLYTMIFPLLLVGLGVSMGSALLAGEEETGQLELLLAHPVSRTRVVLEKAVAMAAGVVLLGALAVVLIVAMGQAVGLRVGLGGLLAATLGAVLYGVFHGAVALVAGATRGGKGFATGLGWGVALVGYLFTVMANLTPSLDGLKYASPLYYATADMPIANGVPWEFVVPAGGLVVLLAAAVAAFGHHDLR